MEVASEGGRWRSGSGGGGVGVELQQSGAKRGEARRG